ncbi:hypothetical protein TNCV_1844061 [Trichonephila clavipes]|nr:hypothetical protein TNCV_1844061 [Trichonephila clavipes]
MRARPLPGFSRAELGQTKRTILAYLECSTGIVKIYTVQSVFPELFYMCFLWFRITEKYHAVEFPAKRGRSSAEPPPSLHACLKDSVDYIPPTEKKTHPT